MPKRLWWNGPFSSLLQLQCHLDRCTRIRGRRRRPRIARQQAKAPTVNRSSVNQRIGRSQLVQSRIELRLQENCLIFYDRPWEREMPCNFQGMSCSGPDKDGGPQIGMPCTPVTTTASAEQHRNHDSSYPLRSESHLRPDTAEAQIDSKCLCKHLSSAQNQT